MLALEKGHGLHEQIEPLCRECGAKLLRDFEETSLSTLHQMVIMGAGLTFLPALYARSMTGTPGVKLRMLKSRPLYRTIGLAWRASSQDTSVFERVGQHVKKIVRQNFHDLHVHDD
jgi:LysR family transcriptional regulator, hydrogen peroxide-inducible genes activator